MFFGLIRVTDVTACEIKFVLYVDTLIRSGLLSSYLLVVSIKKTELLSRFKYGWCK